MGSPKPQTDSQLPDGWEHLALEDVFKLTSGKGIAVRTLEPCSPKNPYPVYGGNGIAGYTTQFFVEPPVIVIGRVGEYCGVVHRPTEPCWISDNALYTKEIHRDTNIQFLENLLVHANISKLRKKSGQPLVSQGPIHSLRLPFPPLPEQRKIAAILSSVDDAIEKTQAIIAQVQVVKKGLMQELLTRGLPGRHKRFKQTEIGEVPEEWDAKPLGEVFRLTSGKSISIRSLASEGTSTPVPVYGGNGIAGYHKEGFVDGPVIVIGRVGEYCGVTHLAEAHCWVSDNALYTQSFLAEVDLRFLWRLLQYADLARLRKKSGQPLVSQKPIHDLVLPFPRLSEQREIAHVFDSMDARTTAEKSSLQALQQAKAALMSVLLTGEVRVRVDATEAS